MVTPIPGNTFGFWFIICLSLQSPCLCCGGGEGEENAPSLCCICSGGEVKVPLWKKLAYAVGSAPYAMCLSVIGFYFSIFLLEVVIVSEQHSV